MPTMTVDQRIDRVRKFAESLPELGRRHLLAQVRLKKLLLYDGPDPRWQEASYTALGRIIGYTPYPVHRQIVRWQNMTTFGDRRKDLVLAFRGLGKSTFGNYTRALGGLFRNPNIRILMTSDTLAAAVGFHREVKAHLVYNPILRGIFGEFYPQGDDAVRSNEKESTVAQRRDRTNKEATFTCLGIGNQAAGRHFDLVIADDLVTLNESRTPMMRQKLYDWHGSTLAGTLLPHTKVHYIGTRYWPGDLWETLEAGTEDQRGAGGPLAGAVLKIPIFRKGEDGEITPTHPERYPIEVIREAETTMGRYHFHAQMQQDTSIGEGAVFRLQDFRWYTKATLPARADLAVFQYFDLAAKRTETGDFFVGCTIGVHNRTDIYLLEIFRERAGMKRQREMIFRSVEKWRPINAGIEAVQMQAGFAQEIQESGTNPCIPVPVEKDKVFRAMRISPLVESGRVYLPADDCDPTGAMAEFLPEMVAFRGAPNERDDQVDAFVGAVTLAMFGGPEAASPVPEDDEYGEDPDLLADYGLD